MIRIAAGTAEVAARNGSRQVRSLTGCGDPLNIVLSALEERFGMHQAFCSTSLPPFLGGAVGFVSYDAVNNYERIRGLQRHEEEPELYFVVVDRLLAIDWRDAVLHSVRWSAPDGRDSAEERSDEVRLQQRLREIASTESAYPTEQGARTGAMRSRLDRRQFVQCVCRAKEYIAAGDAFQVVLSNTMDCSGSFDPLSSYLRLKQNNPSPYHFFLPFAANRGGRKTLIGASPEVMLQSELQPGGRTRVFMRPVAGTYPRASIEADDRERARRLAADEKELAEHLMLVDLERNDIGRVAEIGSVRVKDLFSVETYRDVHHLVSEVSGLLEPGTHALHALAACFPIGTLAGAPKIRAMEIISELEPDARGIFGGAVVMVGADGLLDSCVAIRSAVISRGGATVRAGAGIVHDSIPDREHEECRWKARALLHSLGVGEQEFPADREAAA